MSDKESAQNVIDTYRRRQQQARRAPLILAIAALLLVVGAAVIIFWLLGSDGPGFSLFATDTPTPTITSTPTSTSTNTPTPTDTPTVTLTPTETLTPTQPGPFVYEVIQGDTLFGIAEKFKIDMAVLIAINNLDPSVPIDIGDKLTIPSADTQLPTDTPIPLDVRRGTIIEYFVRPGETLAIIAAKFNSIVEEIVKENELENENDIQAGSKLRIPVNLVTPLPTVTITPEVTPTVAASPSATLATATP